MDTSTIQTLISLGGIVGSGVSAYLGVKIALVRIETRQDNHDKDIQRLHEDIQRLADAIDKNIRGLDERLIYLERQERVK